ncbi:MAG: formate/nitrite transporter family protein [Lentisphaeria bacterium]|nr:formate/nitrite transporter family protein [Lentisphaeria bacterium]
MYTEVIEKISAAAAGKSALLKRGIGRYLTSSALAGIYVGLGILLIFTVGAQLVGTPMAPFTKIAMGLSFGIALSLVIMAGSDLFTGNNLIMTIGFCEKRSTMGDVWKIWTTSYIGNFMGSVLLAWLFVKTGHAHAADGSLNAVGSFFVKVTNAKMNAPWMELFVRGILCNVLVCLAVFCGIKLKDETAKLIMIFWCLFAFITCGYEHSIANMTLLTVGLLVNNGAVETVTMGGLADNLIPVTLGNMVGGIALALAYRYINHKPKQS